MEETSRYTSNKTSTTVDDFYLSSISKHVKDILFQYMSSVFDIISPSDTSKIDFLSLRIYWSKFGTSVDQTYHIYKNILSEYFEPGHTTKIIDTPIRADPTFKHDLANSIPLSPEELRHYEDCYKGLYNVTIGKLLHIQQWTHPDLNYAISCPAVFLKAPSGLALKVSHHLVQYLHHHVHEPIFTHHVNYHWTNSSHTIDHQVNKLVNLLLDHSLFIQTWLLPTHYHIDVPCNQISLH